MIQKMDFYFKLVLITSFWSVAEQCEFCEQEVYMYLLHTNEYSKEVRPAYDPADVVNVDVTLTLTNLLGINEKEEKMDIMGFYSLVWTDLRLSWLPEDFGNVTRITIPASEIWLPDVVTSNSASSFYEYSYVRDFKVYIFQNGLVFWEYGGVISTNCDIDMNAYPFDEQNCSIHLESWSYPNAELDLYLSEDIPLDVRGSKINPLWELYDHQVNKTYIYDDVYTRLDFTLSWRRRHLYYHMNIVIPAILMACISLGVFWLPVESGEKVSLGVTIHLAFSVFLIIIMDNTPANSVEIPVITIFVLLLMSVTTVALCSAILISYLNRKSIVRRAPKWLRLICFKYLARAMCMNLGVSMNDDTDVDKSNNNGFDGPLTEDMKTHDDSKQPHTSLNEAEFKKMSDDLHKICNYIDVQVKSARDTDEWSAIGMVLDRLFFWISFITLVIVLPLLLLRKI